MVDSFLIIGKILLRHIMIGMIICRMVILLMAEGVSRKLDPSLNIWILAEPLIVDWMRENRGLQAQARDAMESLREIAARLPQALRALEDLSGAVDAEGIRLHPETVRAIVAKRRRTAFLPWLAAGLSVVALILAVIALG